MAYPYAFGSLLYTWGMYCSVVASAGVLRKIEVEQGRLSRSLTSEAARGMPTEAPRRKNASDHVGYACRFMPNHALESRGLLDLRGCHVFEGSMLEVAFELGQRSRQFSLRALAGAAEQACRTDLQLCLL